MKKILFACLLLATTTLNAQQQPTKVKPTCTATTVAGNPCKGTILLKDGKCRSHSDSTPRCGAETSKGKPCKMAVKEDGQKCMHHKDK